MAENGSNKGPKGNGVFFFRMNKGAKAWTKKYRTEIAASPSSVLSTFAALPLDFAKSRMQGGGTARILARCAASHDQRHSRPHDLIQHLPAC